MLSEVDLKRDYWPPRFAANASAIMWPAPAGADGLAV